MKSPQSSASLISLMRLLMPVAVVLALVAIVVPATTKAQVAATLFPAMGSQVSSVYPWAQYPAGVTYNGGIPARTTQCGPTLMPLGNGQSDTPQIQAAINACPAGQHVQLGAGVFLIGNGTTDSAILISNSNITLRGVGPGPGNALTNGTTNPTTAGCGAATCTILYKNGWQNPNMYGLIYVNQYANDTGRLGTSINLAQDGAQGATSITLASAPSGTGWSVGSLVLLDIATITSGGQVIDPDAFWGPTFGNGCAPNCYGWYSRPYRSISQVVKITAINGNVVTIESPLSMTFPVSYQAQLTPWTQATTIKGVGIEDLYMYGGSGGHGNLSFSLCDSCWGKHIESTWMVGDGVVFETTYRNELRDSYIHESQNPTYGGGAYLTDMTQGASNNLFENNIMWNGDKVVVMRGVGPGNVVAYNYMDDAWMNVDPVQPESGVNAGHYTTPQFELLEGNWSHKYSGDSFWGNSIYITVFRNWLTGQRGARKQLATYTINNGGVIYPYCDCWTRSAVGIGAHSYYTNLVGNVVGFNGMSLINGQLTSNFSSTQTSWAYENIDGTPENNSVVPMYVIGSTPDSNNSTTNPAEPTLYQKTNREGNYDYVTHSQIWYNGVGGSGTASTGAPQNLPNSMYLNSKPAFMGGCQWPWVDPSTGSTYTLPAKARFDANTPNNLTTGCVGGGSADNTPPSTPTNLAAAAVSSSGINLTWVASTDNVGVAGYRIFRSGAQVGTSGTNSYSDSGLTASTQYSYTVAAFDAAGNTSPASNAASAATLPAAADTQAPSTPTNFTATAVSSSQINLSWTASTDNVGLTGYKIFRAGTQVGTSATNSYSDSGLTASTQYSYTVSANDAAGNNSAQSSAASATTLASGGGGSGTWSHVQTGGSAGSNTAAFTSNTTAGNLLIAQVDWNPSATFTSVTDTQGNTWAQIGSEQPGFVKSRLYYAKNIKGGADTITATLSSGSPSEIFIHEYAGLDTTAPLQAFSASIGNTSPYTSGSLTTTSANELLYGIEIDGGCAGPLTGGWTQRSTLDCNIAADMNAGTTGSYAFTGTGGGYVAWIAAFKTAGGTPPPPPSVTLAANPTSITTGQSATLTWSSTNATSCTSTNFTAIGTSGSTSVAPTITTTYSISCLGAGGTATQSTTVTVTSSGGGGDTTPPSIPTNLSGTALSANQINLSWSASTDNIAVAGYRLYRNGTLIASQSSTSFSDTNLTASTQYSYTVSASDAALNTSAQSAPVAVITPSATIANKFVIDDRVKTTAKVNVRSTPSTGKKPLGQQRTGFLGTVVSGPQTGSGYTWWQINFDSGVDGWVAQNYLTKVVTAVAPTSSTDKTTLIAQLQVQIADLMSQIKTIQAAMMAGAAASSLR